MSKVLIKNGTLHTMTGGSCDKFIGDILLEDNKIKKIDKDIICQDAKVIDSTGLHVLPGLIDSHTHIGLFDVSSYPNTKDDANEITSANTAEMDVRYSVNTELPDFKSAYRSGVTSIVITEGSANVINGSAMAAKTYGNNIFDMQIKYPVALKVAFGGNPKRCHGMAGRPPYSRMAVAEILTEALQRAKDYMDAKDKGLNPPYDAKSEAIIPVLKREIPLKIHCRQFDMLWAIEIAKQFNCRLSLDHAWGATDYVDEIAESGAMVCYGPVGICRGDIERTKADVEAVKILDDRGVLVSIMTDSPLFSEECICHYLGEAVREGLNIDRAHRMVTINAATIAGIEDRVGSLEVGKDADIVIFKGILALDADARVMYTIIDGQIVYEYDENC